MPKTCRLTGETGRYVDSHLIPKALTRPETRGHSFLEAGQGTRPIKRPSSWYDNKLVTMRGEKILSEIDDWAIKKLREHRLVWSGWGPITSLHGINDSYGTDWGMRTVIDSDWSKLRLFFLSLLWRAAASSRREFNDVTLPPNDLERLRKMVVNGDPNPIEFYPVQLIQLSTRGEIHNQSPFMDIKTVPAVDGAPEYQVPITRFYFDGLIAHFDMRPEAEIKGTDLECLLLGSADDLAIITIPYDASFQRENVGAIREEAYQLLGRR